MLLSPPTSRRHPGPVPGPGAISSEQKLSSPTKSAQALVPTIFHETWWLEKATGGRFEEVEENEGGRCIGRLPYLRESRLGFSSIRLPMMTHFLGPAIDDGQGSDTNRLIKRITIARELIAKLPPVSATWIKCHRDTIETLAFQDAGYVTLVQFTSEIGPAPEATLWAAMRDTHRRVIRKAGSLLTVTTVDDPERFMAFYAANLADRKVANNYDSSICQAVIATCLERGVGRVLAAMDDRNQMQAAIFTVWDATSEYYLMTTRTLGSDNGATALLIWHAIRHASENSLIFDLDGYSAPGDTQFFTRFGGVIKPRYGIHKATAAFRVVNKFVKID